jgi:3-deoxy-D-manno-octulosonic-acid transferase
MVNPAYAAYALISSGLVVAALPFYWVHSQLFGRRGVSLSQRLGVYDQTLRHLSGFPRIWIHAVSVGEINVAGAVIYELKQLMPGCGIVLSTSTPHGHAAALEKLGREAICIFAPVDFILSVQKALTTVKPDILVCLETEIWPNWLMSAQRMGIKTALINGRLSVRSIGGYLKIRPLMKATLAGMDAFSMIHAEDAHRIELLGASSKKVTVGGNAKYDFLFDHTVSATSEKMAKLYNAPPGQPVIVAGSTRGIEGKVVLEAFQKVWTHFPGALLIIAPRHLKHALEIKAHAQAMSLSSQLRTEIDGTGRLRTASVVIVDTMGELQATYSIASVVFCGGSLVPLGGQNVLEAAVWGKPVLYGPSMDDFLEAKELLEDIGGGIQVADGSELAEKLIHYLSRPDVAAAAGHRARQAVLSRSGAALRHARVIHEVLSRPRNLKNRVLGADP